MRAADGLKETGETRETSAGGLWPSAPDQQAALLVELDRVERLRLEKLEPDPLRRAQIVDRAMDLLMRRMRRGTPPECPRAWFRRVVDRFARSEKIPYAAKKVSLDRIGDIDLVPETEDPQEQRRRSRQAAWLRENQDKLGLSERAHAILRAAFDHRSNRAAAKSLGMTAWNFRRDLCKLAEKISPELRAKLGEDAHDLESPPHLRVGAPHCRRGVDLTSSDACHFPLLLEKVVT